MTWREFKQRMKAEGVTDSTEISYIDGSWSTPAWPVRVYQNSSRPHVCYVVSFDARDRRRWKDRMKRA